MLKSRGLSILLVALGIAVLVLAGQNLSSGAVDAADGPGEYLVTVHGTGVVEALPDRASVRIGVETEAQKAQAAIQANANAINKVIAALKEQGAEEKDMATSRYSVYPVYGDGGIGIRGYRVVNTIVVSTTDLEALGPMIDAAAGAGANRINAVDFERKNADEDRKEALKAAVKDARQKAEVMAAAAGVKIVEVVSMAEEETAYVPLKDMERDVYSTTIMPGEVSFTSRVVIVYRFSK